MTSQQLKNSILQMAVQGKLVPQDPNDEPASVLLEKIRAEKAKLVKEKNLQADKNESFIYRGADNTTYEKIGDTVTDISDQIPFDIPDGWEWVRWGNLSESIQYGYNAPAKDTGRIKMVRISDIQDNGVLWDEVPFCDISEESIEGYLLRKNDILFARTGGTVGKSYLVNVIPEEAIYAGYLIRTRYSTSLSAKYLKYYMESKLYWMQLRDGTIATAQPNCNGKTLSRMLVPLPPLSEQYRIVVKIEELLPYIERYDEAEQKLTALNAEFPDKLKKSILQMAVQGKLVPQNSTDEPASVLLAKIRAEKEVLIKQGKIKRNKNESVIYRRDNEYYEKQNGIETCISEQIPFEIPEGWEWVQLPNISVSELGKTMDKSKERGDLCPYLCSINVYWSGIDLSKVKQAKFEKMEMNKYLLHKKDLLICEGGDVGRCAIWNSDIPMYYQNALHRVRFYCDINPFFYKLAIEAYKGLNIIDEYSKGMTIKHLVQSSLNSIYFPLPPLSEQHRIVQKIEELLPLSDKLT